MTTVEQVREKVEEDMLKIALYMSTTMGFPVEVFKEHMEAMNLIEQYAVVEQFKRRHPKAFKK